MRCNIAALALIKSILLCICRASSCCHGWALFTYTVVVVVVAGVLAKWENIIADDSTLLLCSEKVLIGA